MVTISLQQVVKYVFGRLYSIEYVIIGLSFKVSLLVIKFLYVLFGVWLTPISHRDVSELFESRVNKRASVVP